MLDTSHTKHVAEKDNVTNRSRKENVWNFKVYLSTEEVQKFSDMFLRNDSYNTEYV